MTNELKRDLLISAFALYGLVSFVIDVMSFA